MIAVTSPESWEGTTKRIFLAGSIEMGKAIDWQSEVVNALADTDLTLLNPRRADWDSSWVQSIDNAQFREQVLLAEFPGYWKNLLARYLRRYFAH